MKRCTRCKQEKPFTEFSPNGFKWGAQRYKSSCKACHAEGQRTRRVSHDQHVFTEVSPHPKDIVRVSVKGWGFVGVFSENGDG